MTVVQPLPMTDASPEAGQERCVLVAYASRFGSIRGIADADEFVRRNLDALATRPVWLFSVGTFGDRKPIVGPLMTREPTNIRALEQAIHPRDYRVFAG
jgi:menaquinone-dependent protoporphyrinogen oxidase